MDSSCSPHASDTPEVDPTALATPDSSDLLDGSATVEDPDEPAGQEHNPQTARPHGDTEPRPVPPQDLAPALLAPPPLRMPNPALGGDR